MKRIEILQNSLKKKEGILDQRFEAFFSDVKRGNGQPMNDKRNGVATMNRWEKKEDAIRSQKKEIEKTERAIEKEEGKISGCEGARKYLPSQILEAVDSGELIQWRKHPNTFFVGAVDKARIVWDKKKKILCHRYTNQITDKDQFKKFAQAFNRLSNLLNLDMEIGNNAQEHLK